MGEGSAHRLGPVQQPEITCRGRLPVPLAGGLVAAICAVVPCLVVLAYTLPDVAVSAYIAAVSAGVLAAGLAFRRTGFGIWQFTLVTYALGIALLAWIWGSGYQNGSGVAGVLVFGPVVGLPLLPLVLVSAAVWREILIRTAHWIVSGRSFARAMQGSEKDKLMVSITALPLVVWIASSAILLLVAIASGAGRMY